MPLQVEPTVFFYNINSRLHEGYYELHLFIRGDWCKSREVDV